MRYWVVAIIGCLGCGGPAVKPTSSPGSDVLDTNGTEAERRPYAELLEASSPEAQVSPGLWLRLAAPAQLASKLPESVLASPQLTLLQDPVAIAVGMYGPEVGSVIDFNQPLDIVQSVSDAAPDPPFVLAFRVRSPEAIARGQAGLTLRRLAAGTWLIGQPPPPEPIVEEGGEEVEDQDPDPDVEMSKSGEEDGPAVAPCLLLHAPAPVGFRVLCGSSLQYARAQASFLVQPQAPPAADVHLELSGPLYRAALRQGVAALRAEAEAASPSDNSERFGSEVGLAMVEALAAHDQVSLDVTLGKQGVEALLDVSFTNVPDNEALRAWLRPASQRRLPPSFALLPADASLAFGFAGLGKETTQSLLLNLLTEVAQDMQHEFILNEQQRREMDAALAGVLPEDAHFSVAMGQDGAAIERVLTSAAVRGADEAGTQPGLAAIKELQAVLGGWLVIGLDVPAKRYMAAVERAERANAIKLRRRPGVPRNASEREDNELKRRPLRTRGLPPGTVHFVEQVRPAKTYRAPLDGSAPPRLPFDRHLVIVPDGERVWVSVARSEALAGERALAVLRREVGVAQHLESRRSLERPLVAALSFTLSGLTLQGLEWDSALQREMARFQFRMFGHHLRGAGSPLLITFEAEESGLHLRARARLSPQALSELVDWRTPHVAPP